MVGSTMSALVGLSGQGATIFCIFFVSALMIFFPTMGGMRGAGMVQIAKIIVLLGTLLAIVIMLLNRFHWDGHALVSAAEHGSGAGAAFLHPGSAVSASRWDLPALHLTVLMAAMGLPSLVIRLNTARDARSARGSMRWAVGLTAGCTVLIVIAGVGVAASSRRQASGLRRPRWASSARKRT
ncbi:hypothetical protein [Streptomyces sp. NPDC048419]|uniref:hypothetical protein n=1 Tax=Streptomyces sp. NPDC048419 TaxID=3365547 RepID=UPI0037214732